MRIDEILECVNTALDKERHSNGFSCPAYFNYHKVISRKIGATKEFSAIIQFTGPEKSVIVCRRNLVERALEGLEESKVWERVEKELLSMFIKELTYSYPLQYEHETIVAWRKFLYGEYKKDIVAFMSYDRIE